jgi:very-short-patch-repair endonuclease
MHSHAAVLELAASQCSVVSRGQLYALGLSRGEVKAQLRARRWQAIGRHCVATHNGPVTMDARYWVAVLEAGPRALIDGESSLLLAGLEHYTSNRTRVSVPRGARIRHRGTSLDIRQTRRWCADDKAPGSRVPRTRNAVASVRAALWARSDRQASLLMTMAVQQGLVAVDDLAVELLRVRRDKRRVLLHSLVLDLAGGIRSLNELDVVRGCRERGLPEPDAQALRRTPSGSYYLDFRWRDWAVVVEVDGIQHTWATHLIGDALRHNSIAISGDTVLRLPVMGLRVCPDLFFEQIAEALAAAGWLRVP